MLCSVDGAPSYSVMIPKVLAVIWQVGISACRWLRWILYSLAAVTLHLVIYPVGVIPLVTNNLLEKHPQSPCLTLPPELEPLMDTHDGLEKPAALFHGGEMEGSAITFKGCEGSKLVFGFKFLL